MGVRYIKYGLLALLGLVVFMVARTLVVLPASAPVPIKTVSVPQAEKARYADNLAQAIRFKTISHSLEAAPDEAAFLGFHDFLRTTYPRVHRAMELEVVSDYSLMYRWPAGAAASKNPIAFTAHMDVVPVPEYGLKDWQHNPFAGVIDNGVIWGRGAMDDKGMLIALMESAEKLIAEGFVPDRDIYFMFGHDEELGGDRGAAIMAQKLADNSVQLAWLVDEGSAIVAGAVPGVESPVALISLGEKGSVSLRFSATDEGGHSSAPKPFTAASLAARAGYLVTDNPYPLVLDETLEAFLLAVAPEMNFSNRIAIANLWATRPLLADQLAQSPTIAAFMHTTTAFTMMKAGTKTNILPQYGEAIVNYRIHPRDTVDGVAARARTIIDDPRITIERLGGREATTMSTTSGEGYRLIAGTVEQVFGTIPTAPTLTVQGTDARHYMGISDDVYRFMGMTFLPDDLKRIHGTNEALRVDELAGQVVFFESLIRNAVGEKP